MDDKVTIKWNGDTCEIMEKDKLLKLDDDDSINRKNHISREIISDDIETYTVRRVRNNKTVELRSPHSTRPWQHVLEPLSGYLNLAQRLNEDINLHGESFNFGPLAQQNYSDSDLVNFMSKQLKGLSWKDVSDQDQGPYESGLLKLNCDKALSLLNWHSVMDFEKTVDFTAEWYNEFYKDNQKVQIVEA